MSHSKERHEKICLNCNAALNGRYCHVCGQENIEPKETVWGLVSHFFYDITHFDGKFFSTTRYLITRPGFLPAEYLKGRRASYLHPIRMYVFSSALFFLIFFMLFKPDNLVKGDWTSLDKKIRDSAVQLDITRDFVLKTAARTKEDSAEITRSFAEAKEAVITAHQHKKDRASGNGVLKDSMARDGALKDNAAKKKPPVIEEDDGDLNINLLDPDEKYKTVEAYDSVQKALPPGKRDGWWERKVKRRNIELKKRYAGREKELIYDLLDKFMHTLPYLLFISLPLYAFYMKLLYYRHKQFYYVDHGIFFIYLYIFTFIFLLVYFSVMELREYTQQDWIGWLEILLVLGGIYYSYKAMRKFYGQGRAMTLLKFFLLNVLAFFTILILFIFFFTLTVFRV